MVKFVDLSPVEQMQLSRVKIAFYCFSRRNRHKVLDTEIRLGFWLWTKHRVFLENILSKLLKFDQFLKSMSKKQHLPGHKYEITPNFELSAHFFYPFIRSMLHNSSKIIW